MPSLPPPGSVTPVLRPQSSCEIGSVATPFAGHRRDEGVDIVADEIELVEAVVAGMDAELGRRQLEDQPAAARIDAGDFEHVAQEGAVGRLVLA